jgi:predicted lipoprotein with Yx(FWY)xxD motif
MHKRTLGILMAAPTLALTAACGNDDAASTAAENGEPAASGAAAGSAVAVRSGDSELGEILVGEDGLTLYGFTNDVDGTSTCTGTCADAWPPVLVSADWTVGPGLDSGIFSTVRRDDGSEQLVAGKWPLYRFSGDAAPGDVNGQGSGGVWFVVGADGSLLKDAPADSPAGEEDSSGSGDGY